MKKSAVASVMVLVLSLIACFVLTYLWIDRSISLVYMSQSYESERGSVKNLQRLLTFEWEGMQESALQKKLEDAAAKMSDQDVIVKKEESTIWFDQVAFNIRNGRLHSVGSHSRP